MAYLQTPNAQKIPATAGTDVTAGKLVVLQNNANGVLPRAIPATPGDRVVYVALPEDDSYERPTDERLYVAQEFSVGDITTNTGWLFETEQVTYHKRGLASQYEATIKTNMRMIAAKNCVVAITEGCYVNSTAIKQTGALLTIAAGAGNEGKFALAGPSDPVVGTVVSVNGNMLSVHVF